MLSVVIEKKAFKHIQCLQVGQIFKTPWLHVTYLVFIQIPKEKIKEDHMNDSASTKWHNLPQVLSICTL